MAGGKQTEPEPGELNVNPDPLGTRRPAEPADRDGSRAAQVTGVPGGRLSTGTGAAVIGRVR